MNEYLSTTLKVITTLGIGFTVNVLMSQLAAPGHHIVALAVGLLLTFFGFLFAKHFMYVVLLPFALTSLVLRWIRGDKMRPRSDKRKDPFDFFFRALFILAYGFASAVTGIFIGLIDHGMGWFTTSALFGTVGLLLAVLVPEEVIWELDDTDAGGGEPTAAAKADLEQARKDGVPAVLFADKVAKGAIEVIFGKPNTDDKP